MTSRECKFFVLALWFEMWSILVARNASTAHVGKPSYRYYLLAQAHIALNRLYHGLAHIDDVVAWWYLAFGEFEDPWAALLALMFHESVFDPKSKINERNSAVLLTEAWVEIGLFPDLTLAKSRHQIKATSHRRKAKRNDTKLVCDIDLLPLAFSTDLFDANTELIRRENDHLSDQEFYEDRTLFLAELAERGVFQHQFFKCYEEAAQANIARAIKIWREKLAVSRK